MTDTLNSTRGLDRLVRRDLAVADLGRALAAGWRDFAAAPRFGLFFAGIYVAGGLLLAWVVMERGQSVWLIPAIAGFPIVAPFAAVGLYEVSRRRLSGEPLSWPPVLGALRTDGNDQIMLMGAFIFVLFSFWVIIAHGISTIFLAGIPGAHDLSVLMLPEGLAMLGVGGFVGGLVALGLFAMTVTSLPMLLDRDVDCLSAIIVSMKVVGGNAGVMLGWAALIALALALAMLPAFLGLFVVLPVLGHATFHLYRRAVRTSGE